ncbi:MAG: hypothetical protein Q8M72_06520 [Methylocystis sp.]|nr:hypothetical protein [Methylocystis sp.]
MSDEPENSTLALQRKIDGTVDSLREEMATKSDVADVRSELRSEIHSLRADVGSDIMNLEKQIKELEKRLRDQISGLRRSVMEYHSSQIGHGVLLTEFEERLRRLEEHVGLTPEGH